MKHLLHLWLSCLLVLAMATSLNAADPSKGADDKIRVLVVTGGHAFEQGPFYKIFEDNPDITFRKVEHPNPKDPAKPADPVYAMFKPEAAKQYDVIVLYDMWQPITDEAKADFVNLLKAGKGLVALHHSIASFQQWAEYAKIVGGTYYLADREVSGVKKLRCTYKHGVEFAMHVAAQDHPVMQGLKDFVIHDETYHGYDVEPDVKVLLTTDEPLSTKQICLAHTYGASRVVYLQSGHDHLAYENPNFRHLIMQAIRWVAGKGP